MSEPEKFVVFKRSRSPGTESYNGPSWDDVDVKRKAHYDTRIEAEAAAEKLSAVNPMGFDVDYALGSVHDRCIHVTYTTYTPESVAEGDSADNGDETDHVIEPSDVDDDETFVDVAVKILMREGGTDPSNSHFNPGTWYSGGVHDIDYRTGEQKQLSFHLNGFSLEEERQIFLRITKSQPWRRTF